MTKTHLSIQSWIAFICIFTLLLILALVPMPKWIKFILFSIFSFFMGIVLSNLQGLNSSTIEFAIIGTMTIFVSMLASAFILLLLGIQFGFYTFLILFFALLICLLLSILKFYFHSINQQWLSYSIIVLFAIFIVYDTHNILHRNYQGDFITASMDYYLDIINIFIRLLHR